MTALNPPTRLLVSTLTRRPLTLAAGTLLIAALAVAALAPLLAPHDPTDQDIINRLRPPFWMEGADPDYVLGTDALGRDILSRVLHGARISLIIAVAVVTIGASIGTVLGLAAGYLGGGVDRVIMRWVDIQTAFPGLLLSLVVLAIVGGSALTIVIVLAINGWLLYARVIRGRILALREDQFIEAAESIGSPPQRIVFTHLLPNVGPTVMTLAMLDFARVILVESALSFLGLGIQPPASSWGLMIAEGQAYLSSAWWLIAFPGLAVTLAVVTVNVLAGWVTSVSDPTLRGQGRSLGV